MNPYRLGSVSLPPDDLSKESPVPVCFDCGARYADCGSGEGLCGRCDLKWLLRGVDWGWNADVLQGLVGGVLTLT